MKAHSTAEFLAFVTAMHLLAGCAAHRQAGASDSQLTSHHYIVGFVPADQDASDSGTSYYRVSKKQSPQHSHRVPSALERIRPSEAINYPKEVVRLIESADARFLLIEEDVPNDCWMHKNYILVSATTSGGLEHCFLRVPEAPHEGIAGPGGVPPAPNDPSTILRIDGDIMTFRFADGRVERRPLNSIPRISQALKPG